MTETSQDPGEGEQAAAAPKERVQTVLVLGGGGMKGIAHVGAVKALEEAAIRPDAIVGTSIGALVGVLLAGGLGWRELMEIARRMKKEDIVAVNRRALWLGGVRAMSVFDPDPFKEWMDRILPAHDFHEMIVPLRFNATSLVSGREVWFGSGRQEDVSLLEAVYASCALPVYFPPARIGDDVLVDGGVLNPLPLSEAASLNPAKVIAIDVGADLMPPAEGFFDQALLADRRIMVLDEPADGLDPVWIAELRKIVAEWRVADPQRIVIIASHTLPEVERMAERVLLLHNGRIEGDLSPLPGGDRLEERFLEQIEQLAEPRS